MSELGVFDAQDLLQQGARALADVEANGFRIDQARLNATIQDIEQKIAKNTEKLKNGEVWKEWKNSYRNPNIGSRQQLATVLFDKLGYESTGTTKTGRNKTDEESLEACGSPYVKGWLKTEKLKKLLGTYLKGIRDEVVDGYLHPVYNTHLAISIRSSCDSPNFQNIPIRNPKIGELIRSCFVARKGCRIVEVDYSSLEFRICAAFWNDKNMMSYVSDPTKDVHRDIAAECFALSTDEVTKEIRFFTKNQFVFPELYGSYHVQCAKNLWYSITDSRAKIKTGVSLKSHLKEVKGITRLGPCDPKMIPLEGSFEHHIWRVENRFNKRFPEYAAKKEKWWEEYQETGQFQMMTGFIIKGVYSKNQIYNIPIQGPAFHCLLWSLIRINDWLKENKMKTLITGTIHDSIVFDVYESELQEVLKNTRHVMTEAIRKEWDWITVPLDVEFEASPVDGNWWEKKAIEA